METTFDQPESGNEPASGGITTRPHGNAKLRKLLFGIALGAVPVAIGGAVGLLARSRPMGVIAGGASALLLGISRWQLERAFNDEPDYVVADRIGTLEIRDYQPRIEAETEIAGADLTDAIERGFKLIAGYIFGDNDRREKLGMTTPVTTSAIQGATRVAFVMPMHRTLESLPIPSDARVVPVDVPGRRVAALCFAGRRSEELIRRKMEELRDRVSKAGLPTRGEPVYAGFDPPWTLPMLRRNEVWIELAS
jgi:hypothetical protein